MSDFGTGTNLQNVDRDLRSIFIADKGMKYANLDLEQADSRNVGAICWNNFHASRGEAFATTYLDACESGDLHTTVCKMAWRELDWTGDGHDRQVAEATAYRNLSYRDLAKRLGHGTNYFGTPPTMAKHSKVEVGVIEQFQRNYFAAFQCIPAWHEWVGRELKESSALTTLLGRRRYFFGRPADAKNLRDAIAYSPQSMTADEIDTGIIRLWRAQRVQLLLQVHDNVLFQFPEEQEDEIIPWAVEQLRLDIPLTADRSYHVPVGVKTGWNGGDFGKANPDGLKKWEGGDDRTRSVQPGKTKFSLWSM